MGTWSDFHGPPLAISMMNFVVQWVDVLPRRQVTAAALESGNGQDFHYSATHWFLAHCGFKSQALLYPIPKEIGVWPNGTLVTARY